MKSKITKLSLKQNRNLKNYESMTIEATAEVSGADDPGEVLEDLKKFVLDGLYPEQKQIQEEHDGREVTF